MKKINHNSPMLIRMKNIRINTHVRFVILLPVFLLIAACANTQEMLKESENKLTECHSKLSQSQSMNAGLSQRIGQLEKHLEECRLIAEEITSDSDAARKREAELRQLLKSELDEKSVELIFLKGRLTIRLLDRILFDSGSAHILPSGKDVLNKLAHSIADKNDFIRVVGHTDDVGISHRLQRTYPSNWELSAARASSVVRYFQKTHGIDPLRMEAVGLSKYRPVTPNTSDENRQRNRRVEVILTAKNSSGQ